MIWFVSATGLLQRCSLVGRERVSAEMGSGDARQRAGQMVALSGAVPNVSPVRDQMRLAAIACLSCACLVSTASLLL